MHDNEFCQWMQNNEYMAMNAENEHINQWMHENAYIAMNAWGWIYKPMNAW